MALDRDLLERWGNIWVEELKSQLGMPSYPFAPGFNSQRGTFGYSAKNASGSLRDSIESRVEQTSDGWVLQLWMLSYWRYVNDGVPPSSKYPTSGYVSAGGQSEFISNLVTWYGQKLGIHGKEALGRAFGTRYNIWRYGVVPSYFYSNSVDMLIPRMEQEFGENYFDILEQLIVQRVIKDTGIE